MSTAIRHSNRPTIWLTLVLEVTLLLVGFIGVKTALPRVGVPIGSRLVARDLHPFGQDLSVGITLAVIGTITAAGAVALWRLRARWAMVLVLATGLVTGLAFLSLAGFMVSGVFI